MFTFTFYYFFLNLKSDLFKTLYECNIKKIQVFHKMKFDLKVIEGHLRSLLLLWLHFLLRISFIQNHDLQTYGKLLFY